MRRKHSSCLIFLNKFTIYLIFLFRLVGLPLKINSSLFFSLYDMLVVVISFVHWNEIDGLEHILELISSFPQYFTIAILGFDITLTLLDLDIKGNFTKKVAFKKRRKISALNNIY
ncbi:hypothetical protein NCER_102273 [Vairimorpha ceranae BRL01]|uniref:Uncharacterized protein n=1 Tax=Vairimorpha ceranae (strain BRL01) TaxID=578460 RepID=C4VBR4_VAIC1|nr:hypothetical protein NCER_102273 [Vairimorpha ceranae BRL01]